MYLNNKLPIILDKIFINGLIYSIDKDNSKYEAMGISNGRIVFLGKSNEALRRMGSNTEIIDLKNKIILPGFINPYIKIPEQVIMRENDLSLFNCANLDEYLRTIQEYVNKYSDKKVIYGVGWEINKFNMYGKDFYKGPNKNLLDNIDTSKPIVLKDTTGHMLWLNENAFNYFKITRETKEPIGGIIEKDENGELWGTLKDNAMYMINMKECFDYKDKDFLNGFIKFQKKLHSYGITTVGLLCDNTIDMPIGIYRLAEIKECLKLRINYGVNILPYEICGKTIYEQLHDLKRTKIIYKSRYFEVNRANFEADGLLFMKNAFLFKPYRNIEKESYEYYGRFKWDLLEFKEGIKMANRLEFNVSIESRGDNACKAAIDAIDYSQKNNEITDCRNSIVHLDLITKYYMRRMKLLNISGIVHPFWYYMNSIITKNEDELIGEDRIQRLYPYRSLVDNGIITALSSDYCIQGNPDIFTGIECAVIRNLYDFRKKRNIIDITELEYRLNPDERVNTLEAVKGFTIDAAYILGKEKDVGSLEFGKNADFIIIDSDIFEKNPLEISDIKICSTYFNGEQVYVQN